MKISKEIVVFSQEFFKMQQPQQGTAQMRVLEQNISAFQQRRLQQIEVISILPALKLRKELFSLSTHTVHQRLMDIQAFDFTITEMSCV